MDNQNKKISIIIPLFNESENIDSLKNRLQNFINDFQKIQKVSFEIIFVDDHSTDGTPVLLKKLCAENITYKYLRLASNKGSHIAIIAGFSHITGDAAVCLAADLQDPPEILEKLTRFID